MNEDFFKGLLDNLFDGVYFVDRDRRLTYWNKGAEDLTGYRAEDVIGKSCADNLLRHVDGCGTELCEGGCPLQTCIQTGERLSADVYCHHKDGHRVPLHVRVAPIRDASGDIVGAVEVFSDNSAKINALTIVQEMQETAYLDELTGLATRRYAIQGLQDLAARRERFGWPFAVLFVDIDHFKSFNDRFGHDVGDRVLKMVADSIRGGSRSFDCAGRWGGEELVVGMQGVDDQTALDTANRYRLLIERSALDLDGQRLQVTASIGIAVARDGESIDDVVERADRYMYASKRSGRNCVTCASGTYRGVTGLDTDATAA